jgi:hypothetical protein
LSENIRDSDHARQKLTKLTARRRVPDANIRRVYTARIVQGDVRDIVFGRGSTAALHKIPQVFPISFDKVGIEVETLGNRNLKRRSTSEWGICHESRNKHDQRSKSG